MDKFTIILIILLLAGLAYAYIQYLKKRAGTEGYPKIRAVNALLYGFLAIVGISSLLADVLFEALDLNKPAQFEWLSFGAYAIFAVVTGWIMTRGKQGKQVHYGSGDIVGTKNVTNIHESPKKKVEGKELTFLQTINPQNIIGREKDLEKLHQLLNDEKQVVVVNGMGGIGKTTLAAAYAFKYYEEYQHIAWVTQNEKDFAIDLVQNEQLIQSLNIDSTGKDPGALFSEIVSALNKIDAKPKLFIIDNAIPSIEQRLNQLPGQPNWHLLVTSREKIVELTKLDLSFLSLEEGIALFQKYCSRIKKEENIAAIVKMVDKHTLTIEILAKLTQLQRTDLDTLKQALEKDLKVNVKTKHSQQEPIERITSYLTTIFDYSQMDKVEEWLMKQMACLPPEYHTYDLLYELIDPVASEKADIFSETLEKLVQKGWILKNREKEIIIKEEKEEETEIERYKMHRILKEVSIRYFEIVGEDILPLMTQITKKLSLDATKENPIDKFPWIPYGKYLLEAVPTLSLTEVGTLHNNLGLRLKGLGFFGDAKEFLEKALSIYRENLGLDHSFVTTSYSNLALVLQDLGDYEGAKALLEKAVASAEKNFCQEHPAIARRYSNLATVLKDLGDYEGAKTLLEKVVASAEKNFGAEHPSTVRSYSNLATVLKDLGDYEGAKTLLEKAVASDEKNFGVEHPSTVRSYSNLATVLQDLGDYEGAKTLLKKAVASAEKNFGQEHPTTARSYSNLATVLQGLGDYEGAKTLLEKAVVSAEKNFGQEHPTTAVRYSNLALVLKDLGDYEEAKALLEKAVASAEKNFGYEHPTTAVIYSNLATILKDLEDYERALKFAKKSLAISQKVYPVGHPNIEMDKSIIQDIKEAMKK